VADQFKKGGLNALNLKGVAFYRCRASCDETQARGAQERAYGSIPGDQGRVIQDTLRLAEKVDPQVEAD
jgi:hypothetical protein